MTQPKNFANVDASQMKFGSPDGGVDDEHNGVGFVEISEFLETQKHICGVKWEVAGSDDQTSCGFGCWLLPNLEVDAACKIHPNKSSSWTGNVW